MKKTFFLMIALGAIGIVGVGTSNNAHADEVSTDSSTIVQAESVLDESVFGGSTNEGHSITKRDKGDNPYNRPKRKHPNKLSNPGKFEKCVAQGVTGAALTGGSPLGFLGGVGQCMLWQK
ncbi:hypothetical protein [Enterococcus gallinarum]|uniref:Secreted protein n=1 Tax=Enterococcus gallinarum TaxID=1353 RepID=A0ABD4ZWN7_ENTGA|nr:hypothetical protein [Enterococcus gallinarum]MBA0947946.1 hypothetical protein [Enterococcus gallinarum]MBA0961561.1 hypothetical protein [Enterococcus gallinarum]MBA0969474.1 hypothetical protein [Enterococcus gallinarum]MBA0972761.1 hypothetical protein [Enterococcus gallinarum]MBF0724733.1 hypothetical protein [Enterococcus gallinarum]